MKLNVFLTLLTLILVNPVFAMQSNLDGYKNRGSIKSNNVRGYTKKDGTYVAPHKRTNSNNTQRDNWTSKPNQNPYTGKAGTKEPRK